MKLRSIIVVWALLMMTFLAVCGKKTDTKGVKLNLTLLPRTITDFLYVKMNYEFTFSDKFKELSDDYTVFVHFWRPKNKEMLMGDDHTPAKKFSQWKTGDSVRYSRRIFIPRFIDEFDIGFEGYEEVILTIGLYKPEVKESKIILHQETLNIHPESLNAPEIVYSKGWYQPETDLKIKNRNKSTWRWTAKKAVCIIENPKKESLLEIRGGVDKSKLQDQKIIFKINNKILEEFIPEAGEFSKKYIVAPGILGNKDEFKLTVESDKTFIPSALNPGFKDVRELGVQVFFLYFGEHTK